LDGVPLSVDLDGVDCLVPVEGVAHIPVIVEVLVGVFDWSTSLIPLDGAPLSVDLDGVDRLVTVEGVAVFSIAVDLGVLVGVVVEVEVFSTVSVLQSRPAKAIISFIFESISFGFLTTFFSSSKALLNLLLAPLFLPVDFISIPNCTAFSNSPSFDKSLF
jgi:hypothetical protein